MTFAFEPLAAHHDRESFDCGTPALNEFLLRQARQNADRNVGVTHVAVSEPGHERILAYYTLVTRTVEAADVPKKNLPKGDIGVVLLGRLAVDQSMQGKGLGRLCLTRAILQVERAAREIGIHALVLHAKDERARDWYLGLDFGFMALLDDPNHLYLTVATIRQLFPGS
ncbi:MAG: GNAT family N-acetyltransferase [Armatimonadetes bacterium]|nr:GNAT family N-acetyltransferase [Armatimonadota bacterium]